MDEDNKNRWKTFTEEIEIAGNQLVDRVTQLLKEGNVRLLRIRSENGDVFLEIPLTIGAVTGGVVGVAAPGGAGVGALAGVDGQVYIGVLPRAGLNAGEGGAGRRRRAACQGQDRDRPAGGDQAGRGRRRR